MITVPKITYDKYPAYKYSGVEWLGEIPEHWEVIKLKYLIKARTGYAFPSDRFVNEGYPLIRISDIDVSGIVTTNNSVKLPSDFEKYLNNYGVNDGDLLFAMTGGTIGKVAKFLGEEKALLNQRVCSISIENFFLRSLIFFWMNTKYWKDFIDLNAFGGAQPNISDKTVLELPIAISLSLQEQQKIAEFLDEKTEKIDRAIVQKEKMIALLKERKQIIIQDLVTGKKVWNAKKNTWTTPEKTKDSGVEWIGQIPEDWEVKRLKYVLREPLKYGANESGIEYSPELPRYIRISDFTLEGKLNENKKLSLPWEIGKDFLLDDGDILFARSGATVGKL